MPRKPSRTPNLPTADEGSQPGPEMIDGQLATEELRRIYPSPQATNRLGSNQVQRDHLAEVHRQGRSVVASNRALRP